MKLDETFKLQHVAAPDSGEHHVQVAKFQPRSYVAGPGPRCVVWVSGCLRRCPGCFQSQFFDFHVGESVSVEHLAQQILAIKDVEGVTFSGGEPFEQAAALASVCEIVRQHSDLSILAYTGYRASALLKNLSQYGNFLDQLDILIDGEYREEQSGPYAHRGSANQTIIERNKSRHTPSEESTIHPSEYEIQLAVDDRSLVLTGFPEADVDKRLRAALNKRGILLRSDRSSSDAISVQGRNDEG